METAKQKELRRKKELLEGRLTSLLTFRWLAKLSIALAFISLFGSIILGPLALIPETMAWLVAVFGTIAFGAVGIAILCYVEDMYTVDELNVIKMRHEIEDANEAYLESLMD